MVDRSSVTIFAADCTTADALATAVCVLGPERGLELIEKMPRVAALIVRANQDGEVRTLESRRFAEFAPVAR